MIVIKRLSCIICVSILLLNAKGTCKFGTFNLLDVDPGTAKFTVAQENAKCDIDQISTTETCNPYNIQKNSSTTVNFQQKNFTENEKKIGSLKKYAYGEKEACSRNPFEHGVYHPKAENFVWEATKEKSPSGDFLNNSKSCPITTESYLLEILVVVDDSMIEFHKQDLDQYIFELFYTAASIFRNELLGSPLNIALSKPVHAKEIFGTKKLHNQKAKGVDMDVVHENFCKWQNKLRETKEYGRFDVAVLLTRENFCVEDNSVVQCATAGLSDVESICNDPRACVVVEDNGLSSAFTIVHEIGHLIGMPHDDDKKCDHFTQKNSGKTIMQSVTSGNQLIWSPCSKYVLENLRMSDRAGCLLNHTSNFRLLNNFKEWWASEQYPVGKQCKLINGPKAEFCKVNNDTCGKLYCFKNPGDKFCYNDGSFSADRTPCGSNKMCVKGECRDKKSLTVVDGKWGKWSPYGTCSRTCGGGIKRRSRQCDSPAPQFGGKLCDGTSTEITVCQTQECEDIYSNFRDQQCAMENNNNLGFSNVPQDVKWKVYYDSRMEPCDLICRVDGTMNSYVFPQLVIDGTKCSKESSDICIARRCVPFGCDSVLGSTAKSDVCRVCKGDNSTCSKITGSKDINDFHGVGYHDVVTIPAHSHSIFIKLVSNKEDPANFLALSYAGGYLLNGEHLKKNTSLILKGPGFPIEYDNVHIRKETLTISRPTSVDLVVKLYLKSETNYPFINYVYVVPKTNDKYQWVANWTECSEKCNGEQKTVFKCQNLGTKAYVSEDKCSDLKMPQRKRRKCNTNCASKKIKIVSGLGKAPSHD